MHQKIHLSFHYQIHHSLHNLHHRSCLCTHIKQLSEDYATQVPPEKNDILVSYVSLWAATSICSTTIICALSALIIRTVWSWSTACYTLSLRSIAIATVVLTLTIFPSACWGAFFINWTRRWLANYRCFIFTFFCLHCTKRSLNLLLTLLCLYTQQIHSFLKPIL